MFDVQVNLEELARVNNHQTEERKEPDYHCRWSDETVRDANPFLFTASS